MSCPEFDNTYVLSQSFILSAFEKLLARIPAWMSLLLFGEGLCATKSQTEVNNGGEVEADRAMCYSRAAEHEHRNVTGKHKKRSWCKLIRFGSLARTVECVFVIVNICMGLLHALVDLPALRTICHAEVRRAQSGQTAVHYWAWFRVLESHRRWDKFSTWCTDTEEHRVGGNLLLAP